MRSAPARIVDPFSTGARAFGRVGTAAASTAEAASVADIVAVDMRAGEVDLGHLGMDLVRTWPPGTRIPL